MFVAAATADASPADADCVTSETSFAAVEAVICERDPLRPIVATEVAAVIVGVATGRCCRLVATAVSDGMLSGALRELGLPSLVATWGLVTAWRAGADAAAVISVA